MEKKLKGLFGGNMQQNSNNEQVQQPTQQPQNTFSPSYESPFEADSQVGEADMPQQHIPEPYEQQMQYQEDNMQNMQNDFNEKPLVNFSQDEENDFIQNTNNFIAQRQQDLQIQQPQNDYLQQNNTNNIVQENNDEFDQNNVFAPHMQEINENEMRLAPPTKNTGVHLNQEAHVPLSNIFSSEPGELKKSANLWTDDIKPDDAFSSDHIKNDPYKRIDKDTLALINHNRMNMVGEATAYTNAPIIIDPFANEHENLSITKLQRKDMIWVFSLSTLSIILLISTIIMILIMFANS